MATNNWSTPTVTQDRRGQSLRGAPPPSGNAQQLAEEERERLQGMGQPGQDMPELVAQLLQQKMAGAEITGMDAQLTRAAKLRDTPYNQSGQFTTGGIGAAMGAMSSFLDRSRGQKEHGELSKEMDAARAKIAEGEAAKEARGIQQQDRRETREIDANANMLEQQGLTRARQERQDALQRERYGVQDAQWKADQDRLAGDAEADALEDSGSYKGDPWAGKGYSDKEQPGSHMTEGKDTLRISGELNKLADDVGEGEGFTAAEGVKFNKVQELLSWGEKEGLDVDKYQKLFGGTGEGKLWKKKRQRYNKLQSELEFVFKMEHRHKYLGTAQTGSEGANYTRGIGIHPAQGSQMNLAQFNKLVEHQQNVTNTNIQRAAYTPKQWREMDGALVQNGYEWHEEANRPVYVGRGNARKQGWEMREPAPEAALKVEHTRESLEALRESDPEEFARVIGG